jgi:hypothetical protein
MTGTTPALADLHEPPPPTRRVLTVGLVGVGLSLAALLIGLATGAPVRGFDAHPYDGPRALLSVLGLLVAGCAVSMRPGWFGGWLCAAACGLIGYGVGTPIPDGKDWYLVPPRDWYAGLPNAWDSVQLFFGVAGAIGLIGAVWTRLPWRVTLGLILIGVAYHFCGIVSAILSPPPTPYLADQYWKRVSRPYLQFAYMNNAYQFYSPDPGPACEIWACIEYRPEGRADDPDAPKECQWVALPKRKFHYKDPLGVSYYRRLSLTENIAQYQMAPLPMSEQIKANRRRAKVAEDPVAGIPRLYPGRDDYERRVPNDLIIHQVLPSYARRIAFDAARPGWEVRSVKVYRALHLITTLQQFRGYDPMSGGRVPGKDPYNAALYLPYFQGEYDRAGKLLDPADPMLFWLVPIMQVKQPDWNSRQEYEQNGGFKKYFADYVSRHADCKDSPASHTAPRAASRPAE